MGRFGWWGLLLLGVWACDDGGSVASGGGADATALEGDGAVEGDGAIGPTDATPAPPVDAAMPAGCAEDEVVAADGSCRPRCEPGTCTDGHCGPSDYCEPGPCAGNADCAGDGYCDEGRCQMRCDADAACGAGRLCRDGRCTKDPDCDEAETCGNGRDDDCNGVIDDPDFCPDCVAELPCDTGLSGDCVAGRTVCEGGATVCRTLAPQDEERCNGLDDDCDGSLDEGFEMLGQPCDLGVPGCAASGRWRCTADGSQLACGGSDDLVAEVCNGLDDDCDGHTDEGFGDVGQACDVGVGRCAAQGVLRCSEDGAAAGCDAVEGQPRDEICNGLDDDCDAQTDELWPDRGRPCAEGEGACRAEGVIACADEGDATFCRAAAGVPDVEICNGLDDDCDGSVDEGPEGGSLARACYGGTDATRGRGECRDGEQTCVDGRFGACDGAVLPEGESCNGLDDDCNGETDDDGRGGPLRAACYTGDPAALGLGDCVPGFARCAVGEFGACEGEVVPRAETCDQTDEDCDGAVDEDAGGCQCAPGETRPCYGGADGTRDVGPCVGGEQACDNQGLWGRCAGAVLPAAETCDGVDQDCDGRVDEALVGDQVACEAGQGACRAAGVRVCDPAQGAIGCDAPVGQPAAERCDALDNDCDGAADEDFPVGDPCTGGVGACRAAGALGCDAEGQVVCLFVPGPARDELCNGADDDCDGRVDEAFDVGEACTVGDGLCASGGVKVCAGVRRTVCDAEAGQAGIERCNGGDDDCDGFVDEGLLIGTPCRVGVGTCETLGERVCSVEGGTTCDARPPAPGPEVCDGEDDDCDGHTDEGLADLGPCATGQPGVCAVGRRTCQAAVAVCVQSQQGIPESCDGADNDCDGNVDEGRGQQACGQGVCARILPRCLAGEVVTCDPLQGALEGELCNLLDDDCDGRTDESTAIDSQTCGAGVGACSRSGQARCVNGARVCDAAPGQPVGESCDGEDDDCDGTIDEDSIGAQERCAAGVGACRVSVQPVCVDGARQCPAVPGAPGAEVCNGLDDDCDGNLDEGFQSVVCGLGICRHAVPACDGGEPEPCDPLQGAGVEACNGEDDDCDGRVDEQAPGAGAACSVGRGPCRRDGLTACTDGRIACGAVAGEPADERCNGLDDDCDGTTDEGTVDTGAACGAGIGGCRGEGQIRCVDGAPACSAVAFTPRDEICNGRDDDCDGVSDEALGFFTCGRGACRRQVPECTDGGPTVCEPAVGAVPEACNGADDDCDGRVDEQAAGDLVACSVGTGACRRDGAQRCLGGALQCDVQPGAPRGEVCNGLDDDCDGNADEGFDRGGACAVGVGACRADGVRLCAADGTGTCSAVAGAPGAEICDGQDDDCDGRTDETAGGPDPCGTGASGVCAAGHPVCQGGVTVCVAAAVSAPELCDGLDDDCDGATDEDLGTVACGRGTCAHEEPACTAGAPTACDPRLGAVAQERCDGLDDDCDGFVDEQTADVDQPCVSGEGICARAGLLRCANGGPRCNVAAGNGLPERCNGLDDDCDGTTDEDSLDAGGACALGVGACRAVGAVDCLDGALACSAVAGGGSDEICNGLDDDCDGTSDEGFAGGIDCGQGACFRVIPTCDGQAPGQCDPLAGASPEVCNGVDDDCDGATDEDVSDVLGEACFGGRGACAAAGLTVCRDGAVTCDAALGGPVPETCDGIDQDCDGRTDEQAGDVGGDCTNGVGACGRPGTLACLGGRPTCDSQPGPAAGEVCNGADDDCDGATDEALGSVICGRGLCRRTVPTCTAGQPTGCDPFAGALEERCNGADDDCDGITDEDLGAQPCGEGACARDVPRCRAGQVVVCEPFVGARPELCNGLDDDCDGPVDEQAPGVGGSCFDGVGECLDTGLVSCAGGGFVCDAHAGPPGIETCNALDDDCDGAVDEDPADTGNICRSGGLGECSGAAITFCRAGIVICPAQDVAPGVEVCDGLDNDCDGLRDQALPAGPDCNDNQRDDACEVSLGDAADCDGNGTPDTCDIAAGRAEDCNANGIPDSCNGDGEGCLDPVPPTITVTLNPPSGPPGTVFQVVVIGQDDRGVVRVEATVDGVPLPLDANGLGRVRRDTPGIFVVFGRVTDFGGNVADDEVEGLVTAPGDVDSPLVIVTTPAAGAALTEVAPVRGTVTDAHLRRWTLSIGPAANPAQRVLATGTTPVFDDLLGYVDVGVVGVGDFVLRLEAADINGRLGRVDRPLRVVSCTAAAEICDGFDNDCDGTADEPGAGGDDCDADGVDDACQALTDEDCDHDGVPDVCAFDDGATDCNHNGVPDDCDVGGGLSEDCNGNGIPDECLGDGLSCLPDETPPTINLVINPRDANQGQVVTLRVDATDDVAVVERTLSVDGRAQPLDASFSALFVPPGPGSYPVVATARDAAGNESRALSSIRVEDQADNQRPQVLITAPVDTSRLGLDAVTVRGNIQDLNADRFVLEWSVDQRTWTLFAEGYGERMDAPLGVLDPTVLPPGLVFVRLTAEDVNGASSFHLIAYQVPDGLSVGEYRITIRDLDIPLRGIPLTIDRAYDSRDRATSGDFGHGWTLEAQAVSVREDLQSNVMIRLPNGRREVFAPSYAFNPIFPFGVLSYVAPAGVPSTLLNVDDCLPVNTANGVLCFFSGKTPAQTISNYRLTGRDGTVYVVNDQAGLQTVTSPNGDVVTFERDRIHSTTGVELRLTRDLLDRVTEVLDPLGGTVSYAYDARGDLVQVTDQVGGVQTYAYDAGHFLKDVRGADGNRMRRTEYADGRKIRDIDALGNAITYDHDVDGRTEVVTDRRGNATSYVYDEAGRVVSRVDAQGNAGGMSYDATGNLTEERLSDGRVYQYRYDARNLPTEQIDADGSRWQVAHDDFGQVTEMVDPAGNHVVFTYDGPGRPVTIENSAGERFTYTYDAAGNRASQRDASGAGYAFTYDGAGNVTRVEGPEGYQRTYEVDEASRITRTVGPRGGAVSYRYDAVGRLAALTLPSGATLGFERDGLGRLAALIDAVGARTAFTYEARGQLASVTQDGALTRYTYDPSGNLESMTDGRGRTTTYGYDALDHLVERIDAVGQRATFTFGPLGLPLTQTDEDGIVRAYAYDAVGRLVGAETNTGETQTIGYDTAGSLATLEDDDSSLTFARDGDGRITEVDADGVSIAYTHAARGRRATRTDPTGQTLYAYDDLGLLAEVTDPEGRATSIDRDLAGNVTGVVLPGGTAVTYTYDLDGRALGFSARDPQGAEIAGEVLTLDAEGRPTRVERQDGTVTTLTYDPRGQLAQSVTVDGGGNLVRSRRSTYDAVGNRIRLETDDPDAGPQVFDFGYDALDRLTVDGRYAYAWDGRGDMVRRTDHGSGDVEAFAYDASGHLVEWTRTPAGAGAPDRVVTWRHDVQGQRIEKAVDGVVVERSVYDADHRALDLDAAGNVVARYLHGGGVDHVLTVRRGGAIFGYVLDTRGLVVALVAEDGTVVTRYAYDDFGEVLEVEGADVDPLRFAARPLERETGLYDLRARDYDPTTGRFVQCDPEKGTRMAPLTLNPYIYARNAPYHLSDPSGRATLIKYGWKLGEIFGAKASAGSPNYYELMGSFIGFMHGFASTGLVFLANVLDLSGSDLSPGALRGEAISRTEAKMGEIKQALGFVSKNDYMGFAGAFVNGAQFKVGIKITLKSPVDLPEGFCTPATPGDKRQCKEEWKIEKSAGGFGSGVMNYIDYLRQLAPG